MKRRLLISCFMLLFLAGCNHPGKESFELGRQLEGKGRLDEAIPFYEDAITKEQDNSEYRAALAKARSEAASRFVESARKRQQAGVFTYEQLRLMHMDLDKALKADPSSAEARSLSDSVKKQMDEMLKRADSLYRASEKAAEARDWTNAINRLRELAQFYPGYLDLPVKLARTESSALSFYLKEIERLRDKDDVEGMIAAAEQAVAIQPSNQQIAGLLKNLKSQNTATAWFDKALTASRGKDWQRVALCLRHVKMLNPDQALQSKVADLSSQGVSRLLQQANQQLGKKQLFSAWQSLQILSELSPDSAKEPDLVAVKRQLASDMLARGRDQETAGMIGNAAYWMELSQKLVVFDRQDQQRFQSVKDKLRQRVVKKIAVMDFTPPTNSADAGRLVTDSLLSYMTKNASSDVKILARDVLGAIIKEIEFGQAGLYDIETAKKTGKLKGTDIFIFGSVLQYNVEKNTEESYKSKRGMVGKKKVPNPAFQSWIMANPNPGEKALAMAPPSLIDEEIYETVRYKVGTQKKTANVAISFRVVDVESGEVVITKTIKARKDVQDDFSEGAEQVGIPFDPLQLPPDSELLEKAVDDAIGELGHLVLSRFQNLQSVYLNAAQMLAKKGVPEPVIERYMDAITAEEVKNVSTQVTEMSRKAIERQLLQSEAQ